MAQPVLPDTKNNIPNRVFSCRLVVMAPLNIKEVKNHLIHGLVCFVIYSKCNKNRLIMLQDDCLMETSIPKPLWTQLKSLT